MSDAAVTGLPVRRPPLPVWDDGAPPAGHGAGAGWGTVDIDPFTRWWPQLPVPDTPAPPDPF